MKSSTIKNRPFHVAVYCSAADNLKQEWIDAATAVGRWIGENGATLVYGGVDAGLMKAVAFEAKKLMSKIVGVVPTRRLSAASALNDLQIPSADLNDRKATMQLLSDVFVVLPGGYGTLDEMMTAFAYINFTGELSKRILMYNPDGLFDNLIAQFHRFVDAGLMAERCLSCLIVEQSLDGLLLSLDSLIKLRKE